jgi:hypothetical protein
MPPANVPVGMPDFSATIDPVIRCLQTNAKILRRGDPTQAGISPRVQAVTAALSALFTAGALASQDRSNWTALFSAVIGEDIPRITTALVRVGQIVVPTSNPNGHNYATNTPCLIATVNSDGHAYAIKTDGSTGNQLPMGRGYNTANWVTSVTDTAIDMYFASLRATLLANPLLVSGLATILSSIPPNVLEQINAVNSGRTTIDALNVIAVPGSVAAGGTTYRRVQSRRRRTAYNPQTYPPLPMPPPIVLPITPPEPSGTPAPPPPGSSSLSRLVD